LQHRVGVRRMTVVSGLAGWWTGGGAPLVINADFIAFAFRRYLRESPKDYSFISPRLKN